MKSYSVTAVGQQLVIRRRKLRPLMALIFALCMLCLLLAIPVIDILDYHRALFAAWAWVILWVCAAVPWLINLGAYLAPLRLVFDSRRDSVERNGITLCPMAALLLVGVTRDDYSAGALRGSNVRLFLRVVSGPEVTVESAGVFGALTGELEELASAIAEFCGIKALMLDAVATEPAEMGEAERPDSDLTTT